MIRIVISAAILFAPAVVWLLGAMPATRAGLRRGGAAALAICAVGWAFALAESNDNTRDALPAYVISLTASGLAGWIYGYVKQTIRARAAAPATSRKPETIAMAVAAGLAAASIWLLQSS